jgi:hypothetical protein
MGFTSNEAKQSWNNAHYVQIKVSVKPEIAELFKAKCKADGVSMASELSLFMSGQTKKKTSAQSFATRQLRRKALGLLIHQLQGIADAENAYLENIPSNLRNSQNYDMAEQTVTALNDALDILLEAY